jgi:hypothetical protein
MQLELHDVAVPEVVLVDHMRPVPAEDDLPTMVGDLHPLLTKPARRQGHTARQQDLDPLPDRVLEPCQVIRVELDVEPPRHEGPGDVTQLRLSADDGRWHDHNLHPPWKHRLQGARPPVEDEVVLVAWWREPSSSHDVAL